MNIQDKVFVVTGAARGLGLAMAQAISAKGGKLAILDLDEAAAQAAAKTCCDDSRGYTCNVADEASVEAAFARIKADFGRLDGLINNAGLLRDGLMIKVKDGKLVDKMSLSQWQSVIDVNLTGTFLCGREAAAAMAEFGNGGVIINISSVARAGNMGQTNYSATKAGVASMVTGWGRELSRFGIRTGGIAPGVIESDMTASMKPEMLERLEKLSPLGRLGTPEEVALTALYIIENDYFTGRLVEMDGGLRM